jgi:hypothetical protein
VIDGRRQQLPALVLSSLQRYGQSGFVLRIRTSALRVVQYIISREHGIFTAMSGRRVRAVNAHKHPICPAASLLTHAKTLPGSFSAFAKNPNRAQRVTEPRID